MSHPILKSRLIQLASAVAILSGCATTSPERVAILEQAQANYTAAANDPNVAHYGQAELNKASHALEQARKTGSDREEVTHYAYLADRYTETARQVTQTKMAEQVVASASEERNKLLLSARTQQSASSNAKARDLEQKLAELNAKQTKRGLVLTLPDVLFDVGQATLKPGASKAMDNLADAMKDTPRMTILVEGYTDNSGSEDANRELSLHRADAVQNALVERGIEKWRIKSRGHGESLPIASNKTASGRQANRRVEIVVSRGLSRSD